MLKYRHHFIVLALATVTLISIFLITPLLIARGLQNKLGDGLTINGPVHLTVLPNFGISATRVDVLSKTGKLRMTINAQSAHIQIPFTELVLGTLRPSKVIFSEAEIAIEVSDNANTIPQPKTAQALTLEINDSVLRFGTSLFEGVSAEIQIADTGEAEMMGRFFHSGKHGNFAVNLASARRLLEDGSPFDGVIGYGRNSLTLSGQLKFLNGFIFNGRGDLVSDDKALKISGALTGTDQFLTWLDADVAVNGIDTKGSVAISGAALNASLATSSLKVANFDSLWSETLFWDLGKTGRFDLQIQDLSFRDLQLGKTTVTVELDDQTSQMDLTTADGIRSQINLNAAGDSKIFDMTLSGQNTELSKLAPLVFSRGNAAFELKLRSEGKSPAELLSKLSGTAEIDLKEGEILGADMVDFVGAVSKEVMTGWPNAPDKLLNVRSGKATFLVSDGIATSKDISFSGLGYQVTGGGEIDILRAAVDLKIDPILVANDKTKLKLPIEIAIVGPWRAPQIQPDIEGILTDPRAAFARLKSEGFISAHQKKPSKKSLPITKAN